MDNQNGHSNEAAEVAIPISGMYKNYFLDYASYVILERAVPMLDDGLKPVQRRILHALKEMDDGRFHKVANVIGQTMQYHPHGDAAIGDALINLGQKDLLIDPQGNWGDTRTGDSAAAPRYIEARLSKFALEVAFNAKTTEWQASYDGRKKEPVALPVKFPLILAQGVEGIAVGLSTKILPHNFCELIQASIDLLENKEVILYPDFPNGGMIDVENYNHGLRGGKVRFRANIEVKDKNTLLVKNVPYGVTTGQLIDSVLKANDKGKIKVKKVVDNTAQEVEVEIDIANDVSPDVTIDALYAFTDCEVSISPNSCVIINNKPHFLPVEELLKRCTQSTKALLKMELQIRLDELMEKLLFSSLEKIFIENRIYRDIEECETWEAVIKTIDQGLEPYKSQFYREITEEDIIRLTEIKIKRISRFDAFKADEQINKLEEEIKQVRKNLRKLTEYAIAYFRGLLDKFGKGKERRSEIRTFDNINATAVVIANEKLYVNRKEGFVGTGLKKDEYVCDCSDIDDIIVFMENGKYMVSRVSDKAFFGKNIIHVDVWKKGNERMVYHAIYRNPEQGKNFVKRFAVTAITRDREYDVTSGTKGSKLLYFNVHQNSESEVVTVHLTQNCRAKNKVFDFDFATLAIKGRSSKGNVLTKYPVRKVVHTALGSSTLGGIKLWLDETVGRLNQEERGRYLGEFDTGDQILVVHKEGSYELTDFELTNRFDMPKLAILEKFDPEMVISAIHYDGKNDSHYVKRFHIETSSPNKRFLFISENKGSKLILTTIHASPVVSYEITNRQKEKETIETNLAEFIEIKGWKAMGNKLDRRKVSKIKELSPISPKTDVENLKVGDQVEWSEEDLKGDQQGELF